MKEKRRQIESLLTNGKRTENENIFEKAIYIPRTKYDGNRCRLMRKEI